MHPPAAARERARSMLDQLFDKMMLLRIQTIQQNRNVLEIRAEHRSIYDAIAAADSTAAVTALKTHLMAAQQRVVQELNVIPSETQAP